MLCIYCASSTFLSTMVTNIIRANITQCLKVIRGSCCHVLRVLVAAILLLPARDLLLQTGPAYGTQHLYCHHQVRLKTLWGIFLGTRFHQKFS